MKIILPTATAIALWTHEILGQLSDGMWENARPFGHHRYWYRLTPVQGPEPKVEGAGWCPKNAYNLAALIPIVGDRMLAIGRMTLAGGGEQELKAAAWYMPKTYEEWVKAKEKAITTLVLPPFHVLISDELVKKFYEAPYTLKDLKADLAFIKTAMKTAPR